jgi:riboflavin synthase
MLIEYTQDKIIMTGKKVGDLVNLEVDQMGKYCETVVLGMMEGKNTEGRSVIEEMVERIVEDKIEKAFKKRQL